jgi:hypothetical protein
MAGRTIRAELDHDTARALEDMVRIEGRPRSHILEVALNTFLNLSPAARLALFAVDGLVTEQERGVAMAVIGQSVVETYQEILVARQGTSTGEEPEFGFDLVESDENQDIEE